MCACVTGVQTCALRSGVIHCYVPAPPVDEVVVPGAEQHQVGELGGPASFPMPDVVPVAPLRLAITAWVPAVLIPQDEGCLHRSRDRPGRAPVVEARRLPLGDAPMAVRVALHRLQRPPLNSSFLAKPPPPSPSAA